jgi:putative nucleotidyltransferase with HDIG domain
MHRAAPDVGALKRELPAVVLATLVVAVLPGLVAGALQAAGLVQSWWLSAAIAVGLSVTAAAAGSAWWARGQARREIVFTDLMLWGWLRRVRAERRVASTRWLLGSSGRFGPELQAAMLERLSEALEARDARVLRHSSRVARHAHMVAERLGLPPAETARIRAAATVHDVGKIDTPPEILNKPGPLTDTEFATIKRHAARGAQMVSILADEELTAIVRHHHERLDGRGYPDGLRGAEIPLGARIIAVADTFDALTSDRPYRAAHSHKRALEILRANAGTQLDPDVVDAFADYYFGRRSLPWAALFSVTPSRLAVWAASGAQSQVLAPLAAGGAAAGAALLTGLSLGGAPAGDEPGRRAAAPAPAAARAGVADRGPVQIASARPNPAPTARVRSRRRPDESRSAPRRRLRAPTEGVGAPGSSEPPVVEQPSTPGPDAGGGTPPAAAPPGRTQAPVPPAVPEVPELPDLPEVPELPPLPVVPELQRLTEQAVPALDQQLNGLGVDVLP